MLYESDKRGTKRVLPHDPFRAIVAPHHIGWITSMSSNGEVTCEPIARCSCDQYAAPEKHPCEQRPLS